MATINIGRVTLGFSGEWNILSTYERMETVTYQGSTWVALQEVPAGTEPSVANAVYWALAAQKGDKGDTGDQGPQGIQGIQGPEGPAGADGASDWADIQNKPQTATRWPTFGEVTSSPDTATRWPTWDEVSGKPASFPVDAELHDHKKLIEVPANTAPFDNAANTPRAFSSAGFCVTFVDSANGWPCLGRLINVPSYTTAQDGGALQMLVPYDQTFGTDGKLQWRIGYFNNEGWGTWQVGATLDDLAGYLPVGGTAANSSQLGGAPPSSYLSASNNLTRSGGLLTIQNDAGIEAEQATGSINGLQVMQPTAGKDALMSFHVGGDYAVHFGLDGATNELVVGGWSRGTNKYKIYHEGNPPPSGAPTTSQVGTATAGLAVGAVGSYAFLKDNTTGSTSPGGTRAGSSLDYAGMDSYGGGAAVTTSPAGTWRCMGYSRYTVDTNTGLMGNQSGYGITLWLRIS